MRLTRFRANVFTVTATGQELAALIAAARIALDLARADPGMPAEARELLTRVLLDYDAGLTRASAGDGGERVDLAREPCRKGP